MDNEQIIWTFLKGKGFNDYAAAGIMGNLWAESGLKPNNLQNTYEKSLGLNDDQYTATVDNGTYTNFARDSAGYGLAQWTYWTRKQNLLARAKAAGTSIADLSTQLNCLYEELSSNAAIMQALAIADSVKAASDVILLKFERPKDQSEAAKNRRAGFGQRYYDKYAGTTTTQQRESEVGKMGAKVQKAVDYAVAIARDDSHGYDQVDRWGNPNFDCSGLVITAYEKAGVPVKTNGATYTGNMRKVFLKTGFTDVTSKVNLKTTAGMKVGDVLLAEGKHTALYTGSGQLVHASINEKGKATGGATGDQTQKEICVRSYYNYPWGCVLRLSEADTGAADFKSVGTVTVTGSAVNVRTGGSTAYKAHSKMAGIM